ncbi:carbohydrate ABC transporter permease [Paenibacillus thermoaerophilus]|uniref:Carbohydrate ABC transporter permease n=1 Tax=Paenibacillus thermoaerophilus TaxID=1215385 RepID=A0ABW2V3L3_9BACL|nr:carbohydrate ABC transporter permease [Paenibacillus thermoaerophilus]TMV12028.1 carbohydrate ABC transporter permease [Paenibacillus thermoaerophilus]
MVATLKSKAAGKAAYSIALVLGGVIMMYPVIWLFSNSLKGNADFIDGGLIPNTFVWSNYAKGWSAIPGYTFADFFLNSLVIGVLSVIGTVLSSAVVAYGFARIRFPLRNMWFAILMLTLMLPTQVTLVPQYILFKSFGWVGSNLPLIVPHFVAASPFFVFLIVQFIRGIPKDLDEAAKIDGCSIAGIGVRILLPLCKPALVTTGLFCFIWSWDDFLAQTIYLTDTAEFTVPLALRLFLDNSSEITWGPMFAMSVLGILPSFILFMAAQKYFVEGIATTGLKG